MRQAKEGYGIQIAAYSHCSRKTGTDSRHEPSPTRSWDRLRETILSARSVCSPSAIPAGRCLPLHARYGLTAVVRCSFQTSGSMLFPTTIHRALSCVKTLAAWRGFQGVLGTSCHVTPSAEYQTSFRLPEAS